MSNSDPNSIEHLITVAKEGEATVFDLLNEAGKAVKTIEISRRQLQPEPRTELQVARAKARCHEFHDAEAFAEYITRESNREDGASIVLGNVELRIVTCVLDEEAITDREAITFVAKQHPLFDEWEKLLDEEEIEVLEFAKLCQKLRRTIANPDGRELALVFSQVKMAKTITVNRGQGKSALNGVMIQTEIAGKKQDTLVDLPDSITIRCPLFLGTDPVDIEIDLLVDGSGDEVTITATAPDLEAKRIEAFEQLVGVIREKSGLLVGLGSVQHRDWNLVR